MRGCLSRCGQGTPSRRWVNRCIADHRRRAFLSTVHPIATTQLRESRMTRRASFGSASLKQIGARRDYPPKLAPGGSATKVSRLIYYLRSTNTVRHSAGPALCAVCDAVIGTAFTVPALGVTVTVFPLAEVSCNVQSVSA